MNWREVRELVHLRPVLRSPTARALSRCHAVEDFRAVARRRLPRAVFDYVDGGADGELTAHANRAALQQWYFLPRALRDVAATDLTVRLFGRTMPVPLGLAPTGYTRMIHPAGELAVAEATAASGLPYGLSTVGSTSIEDLAATGHQELWFQLYVLRDRALTRSLVERAAEAGFKALEISVDTAVAGRRARDVRNGLTVPPQLSVRTILDVGRHLGYWTGMLRSPALELASVGRRHAGAHNLAIADITKLFDPSVSWDDLAEIRSWWPGPLLLKGPLGPADALRALDAGVDGIHLSNHGGRQLDRALPAIDLVRPVREVVGDAALVFDSGVRRGADIAVALARGADLCMVGRPYLYGLAAAGERGVRRVVDLLVEELGRTLQLLGVTSIAELRKHADELVVARPGLEGVPEAPARYLR